MQIEASCYSVIGSGVKRGIPAVWSGPRGLFEKPFGSHSDAPVLDFTVNSRRVMPAEQGVLIAVYPPRISLEGEPLPEDINFWVGGECLERDAWKRSGNCQGPRGQWPRDRYEIFLLFEGEELALYDHHRKAAFITITDRSPRLTPASPRDVVDYLHQAGMKQRSHRGIEWAIRNIQVMGQTYRLPVRALLDQLLYQQKQHA